MDNKLEARIERLEKIMNRKLESTKISRRIKNEEAYSDDLEGKLLQLYDNLLDCNSALDELVDSNKEIKGSLNKANTMVGKALDNVSKALDYVQMQ
jgi:chromosome segregation ATPase